MQPPQLLNPVRGDPDAMRLGQSALIAVIRCEPLHVSADMLDPTHTYMQRVINFAPVVAGATRSPRQSPTPGADQTNDVQGVASSAAIEPGPPRGKVDIRGLTLGMGKEAALATLEQRLGAKCEDLQGYGLTVTCNAQSPRATYNVAFTVAKPQFVRSVVYAFDSTHDRQTVIADVSRSYGREPGKTGLIDWATWHLGLSMRLHLRGAYELILDDDAIAAQDAAEVQRERNAAPAPRF